MKEVMIASAPRRTRSTSEDEGECIVHTSSQLVSLGGAVLLVICMVVTSLFCVALLSPNVTGVQRFIAAALFAASWLYLLNSVTEHLSLMGREIVFRAALSRTRRFPVEDLQAMVFVHQGLNLEQGIETIEFRRYNQLPERIALGPCWQRNQLEGFLRSVEKILREPHLLEVVR